MDSAADACRSYHSSAVQMIEELLGRAEDCEWDCRGELTRDSNTTAADVAEELLQHANCGGRKVSSRWEDGQAPVLVSGAGHDSLPMSEITKVGRRSQLAACVLNTKVMRPVLHPGDGLNPGQGCA